MVEFKKPERSAERPPFAFLIAGALFFLILGGAMGAGAVLIAWMAGAMPPMSARDGASIEEAIGKYIHDNYQDELAVLKEAVANPPPADADEAAVEDWGERYASELGAPEIAEASVYPTVDGPMYILVSREPPGSPGNRVGGFSSSTSVRFADDVSVGFDQDEFEDGTRRMTVTYTAHTGPGGESGVEIAFDLEALVRAREQQQREQFWEKTDIDPDDLANTPMVPGDIPADEH